MKHIRIIIIFCLFSFYLPGSTQESDQLFADEIRKFKEEDSSSPPPAHAILFIGSSSFRMWQDVRDYFPGHAIINRGFGGSTLLDQLLYMDDIVFSYSPRQIVVYCGENDLASGDAVTPDEVLGRFTKWFMLVRKKLPDARITYVSIKPSPSRWNLEKKFIETNAKIRNFLRKQHDADFVDIWNKMLRNKEPDPNLFVEDSLHMNANGYRIWQKAIQPELIK